MLFTEMINTRFVVVDGERECRTLSVNDDFVSSPEMVQDGGDTVDRCRRDGDLISEYN